MFNSLFLKICLWPQCPIFTCCVHEVLSNNVYSMVTYIAHLDNVTVQSGPSLGTGIQCTYMCVPICMTSSYSPVCQWWNIHVYLQTTAFFKWPCDWLIDWFLFTTDIRQWSMNGWIVNVCTVYTCTILHSTHSINNSHYRKQVYIVYHWKITVKERK